MRKFLAALLLLVGLPVFAQFAPPPSQSGNSTVAFQPTGKTTQISATGTSANNAFAISTTGQVQVYNSSSAIAFVIFCTSSSCTASAGTAGSANADYPVGPGAIVVVSVPTGTTYAAAILSTGTGSVYFTPGTGL